jgi:hypothetical protein
MNRYVVTFILLLSAELPFAFGQQATSEHSAFCTFQDGKEIKVQYDNSASVKKTTLSEEKLWTPGGRPMLLFTPTALTIANSSIPAGAYSMYFIPAKDHWTLVINKSVKPAEYNSQQDLVRAPMAVGQVSQSQPFSLTFAHMAPKQCNLRVYEGKTGTWSEFREK